MSPQSIPELITRLTFNGTSYVTANGWPVATSAAPTALSVDGRANVFAPNLTNGAGFGSVMEVSVDATPSPGDWQWTSEILFLSELRPCTRYRPGRKHLGRWGWQQLHHGDRRQRCPDVHSLRGWLEEWTLPDHPLINLQQKAPEEIILRGLSHCFYISALTIHPSKTYCSSRLNTLSISIQYLSAAAPGNCF